MRWLWGGLLMAAFGLGGAEASPWNRDPGRGLTISRVGYYEASAEGRRFEQTTSELYAEIGVTERFMLGGKLSYAFQEIGQEAAAPASVPVGADALSGFAEGSVFVQGQLARWDGGAVSVMATYGMPTETVSRLGTERAFSRDGSAGGSVLLGLGGGRTFGAFRLGYEGSLGRDADFLRSEATMGAHLSEGVTMMVEAFDTRAVADAALGGADYDLTQVAPSLVLRLPRRMKLQLGATLDAAGRNVDLGAGGFVALWVGE